MSTWTKRAGWELSWAELAPDFSEKRYGFGSFLSFAKAARARDLIAMEWSDDTGDYVLRPTS